MSEQPKPAAAMFDAEVRVETLIYLPGIHASEDSYPDAFREFCESLPEREDAPLYTQQPKLKPFAAGDAWPEVFEVADALLMEGGFLVEAATPVRTPVGKDGAYMGGWGHYHTEWLYAATEADIARVCVEWAEACHAEDEAKSEAA